MLKNANLGDLQPSDFVEMVNRPVYVELTENGKDRPEITSAGTLVSIQASYNEVNQGALICLTDGKKTTDVRWDPEVYTARIWWSTTSSGVN